MFKSVLCETFGARYPIVLAGMGYVSGPELAAAVSNAGGLGTLRPEFPDWGVDLRTEIRRMRELTDRPFGVDMIFATISGSGRTGEEYEDRVLRQLEVICEEKPAYIISALGNPAAAIPALHASGIKVLSLVGNVRQAVRSEAAGVDFIIAQGHEAGGHTGRIAGMVLVPATVDAVKVPVIAAGSIVDPRQMVAAFVLGACGVLMGTRFIATTEASAHPNFKNKIVEISEEGTVICKAYTGKTMRLIRNQVTSEWEGREKEILPAPDQGERMKELYFPGIHLVGRLPDGPGDVSMGCCPAGQGSGMITSVKSVREVIEGMVEGVERILQGIAREAVQA